MTRRRATAALAFLGAAACFAVGLGGESGAWLLAMIAALFLLTAGFHLASGGEDG